MDAAVRLVVDVDVSGLDHLLKAGLDVLPVLSGSHHGLGDREPSVAPVGLLKKHGSEILGVLTVRLSPRR